MGQNYDAPVAEFLRERVKPGAVCIDVGANVGVYVLQFAHWSGPKGRVIAFEPNPAAREVLHRHVRMNHITGRVLVEPFAVSSKSGQQTLFAADADGMSRLGKPNKALAGKATEVTVSVITLDEYCRAHELKPDWLFLDIEGFEIAALMGARELINQGKGTLGIVVELHPNVWDSANTTRELTEELFAELNLRAVALTGQRDPLNEHGLVHLEYSPT